jgi:hypothetical protein
MRIALFHDDDPRIPRIRGELAERGHRVVVVGPGASHAFLARLFGEERPDIIHSFGRGPFGLLSAAYWRQRLRKHGTRRVHDVDGILLSDGHVDGSLTGALLEAAYLRALGLRGADSHPSG